MLEDDPDLLNAIERRLHADRGTVHAECFAARIRNILARYEEGFYEKEDPWENLPNLPSKKFDG